MAVVAAVGLMLASCGEDDPAAVPPAPRQPDLYVDGTAAGGGDGSSATPFQTIQEAIDAATAGDLVSVAAEDYAEDLLINKSLTLRGVDKATTTITGVAVGTSFPGMPPNIQILADDVTIHGFTIASPTVADTEGTGGIILIGTDIEIYDCDFVVATGISSVAIQTYHEAVVAGDISGLHIHDCTFTNGTVIGNGQYEGIYINPQADAVVAANPVIIENNTFDGTLTRAVGCERSYTIIRGNDISTTAGAEVDVFGDGSQTVSSSAIHAVTWDGTTAVTNVSILNNTITGNGSNGWERGLRIGYDDQPMSAISITGNTITGCVTVGIVVDCDLAGNDDIVANNNSISGNAAGVNFVGLANSYTVDAQNNWWGAADGPSGTGSGAGDTVSADVDYEPFLTSAP